MEYFIHYSILLFSLIEWVRTCDVIMPWINIYPTPDEILSINVEKMVYGQNLTYSIVNQPDEVYVMNFLDNVDEGTFLPERFIFITATIRQYQLTQTWRGQVSILGQNPNPTVFYSSLNYSESPIFEKTGVELINGKTINILPGLTYISQNKVIVDTWINDSQTGLMNNSWQIIDTFDNIVNVSNSSNSFMTPSNISGFGRITQYWQNKSNHSQGYLFRGTLSNSGNPSFLEAFLVEDHNISQNSSGNISSSDILNLQMVDFDITNDGEVWILDSVNNITVFNMIKQANGSLDFVLLTNYTLPQGNQFLSLLIEVRYQLPKDKIFGLLIQTNTYLLEYYLKLDKQLDFVGYYQIPVQFNYCGIPPLISQNQEFISVQDLSGQNNQVYIFERGVPLNSTDEFEFFNVTDIMVSKYSLWAQINQMPSMLLQFTNQMSYLFSLQFPQVYGNFSNYYGNNSDSIEVIVTQYNEVTFCIAVINYIVVSARNTSILFSNKTVDYPTVSYFPYNDTLNFQNYLSGPAIEISGSTEVINANPNVTLVTQSIIEEDVVNDIDMNTPQFYPTQGANYIKNVYNPTNNYFLQFIQSGAKLVAYICYQGVYDTSRVCHFIDRLFVAYATNQIEVLFPIDELPPVVGYFFIVSDFSDYYNVMQMWKIEWNATLLDGSFTLVSTITIQTQIPPFGVSIPDMIIDFAIIDQSLYIVVAQYNAIWKYELSIVGNQISMVNKLNITAETIGIGVDNFIPRGVVGNTEVFGSVLFIDNGQEFLIISTINNQVNLLGKNTYTDQYEYIQNVLAIQDQYLVVTQNTSTITVYSISNLYDPQYVRILPIYDNYVFNGLVVASDDIFFYVLMIDSAINVYKPGSDSHDCLYYQFRNSDFAENILFSPISVEFETIFTLINSTRVYNALLQHQIKAIFVPGSYNNSYYTFVQYNFQATNRLGSDPLPFYNQIQVFNFQIDVQYNDDAYDVWNNKFYFNGNGPQNFTLITTSFLYGTIAEYSFTCDLCKLDQVKIINKVTPYMKYFSYNGTMIQRVDAINNAPLSYLNSSIVQNNESLYLIDNQQNILQQLIINSSAQSVQSCQGLTNYYDTIVSVCQLENSQNSFIQFSSLQSQQSNQTILPQLSNVTQLQTLSDYFFILGIDSSTNNIKNSIQIYNYDQNTTTLTFETNYSCPDSQILDYSISALSGYQNGTTQYLAFIMFFTCQISQSSPYYVSLTLNNETKQLFYGSPQTLLNITQYSLFQNSYYQNIRSLLVQENQIFLLLTTNNVMNFINQFYFNVSNTSLPVEISLNSSKNITTVPPYGDWNLLNSISYQEGLLVMPYVNETLNLTFIAVYDLSKLNFTIPNQIPQIMVGGMYDVYSSNQIYQIQRQSFKGQTTSFILLAQSFYNYNLSSIQVSNTVLINVENLIDNKAVAMVVTGGNYFFSQQFHVIIAPLPIPQKTKLAWWVYIVIIIVIAIVFVIMLLAYIYYKRTIQLKKQQERRQSIKARYIEF